MIDEQGGLPFNDERAVVEGPPGKAASEQEAVEHSQPDEPPPARTFEEALDELEGIVRQIEAETLPLEEAITQFEKGMTLASFCSGKLDEAQGRIEKLVNNDDGSMTAVPLRPDAAAPGKTDGNE